MVSLATLSPATRRGRSPPVWGPGSRAAGRVPMRLLTRQAAPGRAAFLRSEEGDQATEGPGRPARAGPAGRSCLTALLSYRLRRGPVRGPAQLAIPVFTVTATCQREPQRQREHQPL